MPRFLNICFAEQVDLFKGGYDGIYFGNEFCAELLPSLDELEQALAFARERFVRLTLTTPLTPQPRLGAVETLLDRLVESYPDGEAVFNDWGVFAMIKQRGLTPIMGRALVRQHKDPRLVKALVDSPTELVRQLRMPALNNRDFEFFLAQGIHRIEFDNTFHNIWLPIGYYTEGLDFSLHLPYGFLSFGRGCVWAGDPERRDRVLGVFECSRACRDEPICSLSNKDLGKTLFSRGNAIFYKTDRTPENPKGMKIDRLIISPELPI